jgi:site-specific DNA recombinase
MDQALQPTAFICLRVSSPSQVNKAINPEGYSIPVQREACERYCREQLGARVIAEFIEPGTSAKDMSKRPVIREIVAKMDELRPSFIVFYDLSRSARNEFDAQWMWHEFTEKRGVLIQSTLERIDDTDAGRMVYAIMSAVNANRIRADARKVKGGLERKFLDGGTMGPARIGYRNAKLVLPGREVAIVEEDPEQADHVRTAFDLYASGNYTLSTLTDLLDSNGLRYRATRKLPSRPMTRASVHRMLSDDFYTGIVTFKGRKLRGIHEPLIEETTFERVQHILAANRLSGDRTHKHQHYLTGRVFVCHGCRRRLGYGRHRGKLGTVYEYFSCLSRANGGRPCGASHLAVDNVEQAVIAYHASLTYSAEQQDRLRQAVRDFIEPRVETARKQGAVHQRRLRDLQGEQQKLVQLSYKGLIDDEVLGAEQRRIEEERREARKWVEAATHEVAEAMEALDDALLLVDETIPYGIADGNLRRLVNIATHDEIAPYVIDEADQRVYRVRGRRDPFYVEADRLLGKTPPEDGTGADDGPQNGPGGPETTTTTISRGRGSDALAMAEREGFEPSNEVSPVTRFPVAPVQPLRHLSGCATQQGYAKR